MKVDLYLMSAKGLRALQASINSGLNTLINQICIGRDSGVTNDFSTEIRDLCDVSGIPWRYRDQANTLPDPDYSIAISWRWLLRDVTNLIVIHDSLLPKYRGFAPLVSQLVNGEREIGVTAIWAKEEYDIGDIIAQSSIPIEYPIKIADAIERIGSCYEECILLILRSIASKAKIVSTPQDESAATYSLWRDDDDYWVNWYDNAERIARFVDAVGTPYKGALSLCMGSLVTINQVKVLNDVMIENRSPGKVLRIKDGYPVVVCGSGLVMITDAVDSSTQISIIPLKSFRSRFYLIRQEAPRRPHSA
jgi:methionyl-tRNA formyltransferase